MLGCCRRAACCASDWKRATNSSGAQAPADSLLPEVAAGGLMLTAVAAMLGVGFTTEIVFGVTNDDMTLDPEFGALVGHWTGTIPWLWLGAGLTGVAVAVASLRHQAAPRWIGWTSAVLGGINAYWITFINPQSVLNTLITDQLVVMVLVGGLGHAWGPALGATALFLLQEQLRVSYGETTAYIIIVGALVMAVVLFLPDGLVSLVRRARRMRLVRQLLGRVVPQKARS